MSEDKKTGTVEWRDLTIDNAEAISEFYSAIVGWERQGVSMGDYDDYNMNANGETIAGVCHARGSNAEIPPQWLMYVRVEDSDSSATKVVELGGEIIQGPRVMGGETYYIIRDPAGAILAIFS